MATEDLSARYLELDAWSNADVLNALFEGQLAAVAAVKAALPAIAAAADAAIGPLNRGGRLVYVGAGTSGRIGVQDGAELPPTFDWDDDRVVYAMAGGQGAILKAVENAKDSVEDGIATIVNANVGPNDVVIGVAASGTTPYTVAAIREATARGAVSVGVSNNDHAPLLSAAAYPILVETGEEVIAGSTRMKAGTAQKIVLNLLSTLIMIRLGRVYRGQMVHMRSTNAKLRRRSEIMVSTITGCDEAAAADAIAKADGDVKLAALIAYGVERPLAETILARSKGNLRTALDDLTKGRELEPHDG